MTEDTTPYEYAFPAASSARQEVYVYEVAHPGVLTVFQKPVWVCPDDCPIHGPSQASPVGEAPRGTGERCDACYQLQVEEGPGWKCGEHAEESRQTPSREETAEAVCATCGHSPALDHWGGVHCARCLSGYCGSPRTSEEPTEPDDWEDWRRLVIEGQSNLRRALNVIDREKARVSELERALAEAERNLAFVPGAYGVLNDIIRPALARPRSTEGAPEEGSDE